MSLDYDKTIDDVRLIVTDSRVAVIAYIGSDRTTAHELDAVSTRLVDYIEVRQLVAEFESGTPGSVMEKCFPNYAKHLSQ